jgi:RHS repeat-associated protein
VNGSGVEERRYVGGWEEWTKKTSGSLDKRRTTLHVMDGEKRIALVETLTWDDGEELEEPMPVVRYQLGNHLGSVALEVDGEGAIISYEEYHPYGTTAWRAPELGEVSAKRYRYTGMERDEETGLQCHGVRYYCCWLGRWGSVDPIGLDGGKNVYSYCGNCPLGNSDDTGSSEKSGEQEPFAPPAVGGFIGSEAPSVIEEEILGLANDKTDGTGFPFDPSKIPASASHKPWNKLEVQRLLGREGRKLLRQAIWDGADFVTYEKAEALFRQPDGSTYIRDVTALEPGEITKPIPVDPKHLYKGVTIYLPKNVSNARAVEIIYHELCHPKHTEGDIVQQEIETRIETETFLLRQNLPTTGNTGQFNYRSQDAKTGLWHVNKGTIGLDIRSNPAYTQQPTTAKPGQEQIVGIKYGGTERVWGYKRNEK